MKKIGVLFLLLIASLSLYAQQKTITGVVKNPKGEPEIGVTIEVKGKSSGTVTDLDGNYTIVAEKGDILVVQMQGMVTQEIKVTEFMVKQDIALKEDVKELVEVVVQGDQYSKVEKRLNASVSGSVSAKTMKEMPVTGIDQVLQGRVSGVQVSQNSSAPGGGVTVVVRGANSLGAAMPLYVIDGVPVNTDNTGTATPGGGGNPPNPLAMINPNDIESMEVLKDASATAIYGSRGANGVIVVNTKRGKADRQMINFDAYTGVSTALKTYKVMNTEEYAKVNNEARVNDGLQDIYAGNKDLGLPSFKDLGALKKYKSTDWLSPLYRAALMQSYQLSVSGGTAKSTYSLGGGYFDQEGVIVGSRFRRLSFRLNNDIELSKRVKIGNSLMMTYSVNNVVNTDGAGSVTISAASMLPFVPIKDANGDYNVQNFAGNDFATSGNPIQSLNKAKNQLASSRTIGSIFAEFKILESLKFKSSVGADVNFNKTDYFNYGNDKFGSSNVPTAISGTYQTIGVQTDNFVTYTKTFRENHDLLALGGVNTFSLTNESLSGTRTKFSNDKIQVLNVGDATTSLNSGDKSQFGLLSYLARVNYTFKKRYIFQANVRRDASSKFGTGKKFGVFPSAALAWRISEEAFMKDYLPFVNEFKFRASYGVTGNQESGANNYYAYTPAVLTNYNYPTGLEQSVSPGVAVPRLPNKDLQWESTAQFDIGIDAEVFKSRIALAVNYFRKNTNQLLLDVQNLPLSTGYAQIFFNSGSTSNRGVELQLNTKNIVDKNGKRGFTWSTDYQFTTFNQIATGLPPNIGRLTIPSYSGVADLTTYLVIGQPVGQMYGYKADGIFQNQAEVDASAQSAKALGDANKAARPGDVRFVDINKDGKIDANDITVIGNPQPKFTMGLTNRMSYKGFELSFFFYGSFGGDLLNLTRLNMERAQLGNSFQSFNGRWTGEGTSNDIPRATFADPNQNSRISSRFVEDGTFIRLRNVVLSYNVSNKFLDKVKVKQMRVYISAQNLLTFTKYTGLDPEVSSSQFSTVFKGIDLGTFPQSRTINIGLSLTL